jgi:hypothetical protein
MLNLLIRHWFDIGPHKYVKFLLRCNINRASSRIKISLANFSFRTTLSPEGGIRPIREGAKNGLENPENRRSAGWHGNQHVCLRRPQVSGSDIFTF